MPRIAVSWTVSCLLTKVAFFIRFYETSFKGYWLVVNTRNKQLACSILCIIIKACITISSGFFNIKTIVSPVTANAGIWGKLVSHLDPTQHSCSLSSCWTMTVLATSTYCSRTPHICGDQNWLCCMRSSWAQFPDTKFLSVLKFLKVWANCLRMSPN